MKTTIAIVVLAAIMYLAPANAKPADSKALKEYIAKRLLLSKGASEQGVKPRALENLAKKLLLSKVGGPDASEQDDDDYDEPDEPDYTIAKEAAAKTLLDQLIDAGQPSGQQARAQFWLSLLGGVAKAILG
jgi:hypothetical protein